MCEIRVGDNVSIFLLKQYFVGTKRAVPPRNWIFGKVADSAVLIFLCWCYLAAV